MGSYLAGWLHGLIWYTGVGRTTARTSPDGEIRGELVLCRRAERCTLANVEKMFVQLKPSPLGRAPNNFPKLASCCTGLYPGALAVGCLPQPGSCKTAFESRLGGSTAEEQKL